MDRFSADLSYCLHLLVGFNALEVNHGGWFSAMFEEDQKTVWETVFPTNGVGPLVVVDG